MGLDIQIDSTEKIVLSVAGLITAIAALIGALAGIFSRTKNGADGSGD